jgi:hypothetical protein
VHNADHTRHRHRQLPLPGLDPTHGSENRISGPALRLDRIQQLTLNTWRLAAATLERNLDSTALLEHAAVYATLAATPMSRSFCFDATLRRNVNTY